MYHFEGIVESRSSNNRSGPPGEAKIIIKNPIRVIKLLELAHLDRLEPGTLNLAVSPEVVETLKNKTPDWLEQSKDIIPPDDNYNAHEKRGGYKYFCGMSKVSDKASKIVLRIGATNPIKDRVELYSSHILRNFLLVKDGDKIEIYLPRVEILTKKK